MTRQPDDDAQDAPSKLGFADATLSEGLVPAHHATEPHTGAGPRRTTAEITQPFVQSGRVVETETLAPVPGTLVAQHYRVRRTIGAGGMGVVLEARDELLMRDVAIKFVQPYLLGSHDSRRRFLDEARAMARVRHPNVVEIFMFGEHDEKPYFVMEYVPGITADQWFRESLMKNCAPPPVDETLGIMDQCCRGVSAVHAAGTTHGDLKPSNVLLGPAFRVALTDLGLALMLDADDFDHVAGTPAYMAPESIDPARDPELAKRRDVYSLGVMAYEFLTGKLPYRVHHPADLLELKRQGPPMPPSQLRSDLPVAFDACLLRALEIDPLRRTPSTEALRRDLMQARRKATERTTTFRFLVVDDDSDFLLIVEHALKASFPGSTIACVSDGAQALRLIEHESFDLAVVDLMLPDLNGVELTATFRASPLAKRTAILIVTAFGGGKDWQLLNSLGANGFLVKPVDPNALAAMVGRMLEQGRPHRAP